jgi:hypothetical protein
MNKLLVKAIFLQLKKHFKHKYYVYQYGRKFNVSRFQLLIHDFSKFLPSELVPYAKFFYLREQSNDHEYMLSYSKHTKRNKHHWEYWICFKDSIPNGIELQIPNKYIKEMVADWFAATKTYTGTEPNSLEEWIWFQENFEKIRLHTKSREKILSLLNNYFQNKKNYDTAESRITS